jgi:hypothetical protein
MAKRIFQAVVFFFALYAFVFVPLGKKTALEHVRAILGSPQAQDAAEEVKGGVTRLVRRLESEARKSTDRADRVIEEHRPRDAREPGDQDPPGHEERQRRAEDDTPAPSTPKLRAMSAETTAPGR